MGRVSVANYGPICQRLVVVARPFAVMLIIPGRKEASDMLPREKLGPVSENQLKN